MALENGEASYAAYKLHFVWAHVGHFIIQDGLLCMQWTYSTHPP